MMRSLLLLAVSLALSLAGSVAFAAPGGGGPAAMGVGSNGGGVGADITTGGGISLGPASGSDSGNPLGGDYRERFLAASGNTNRLTVSQAMSAQLVNSPATFAAVDRHHRGFITLEDMLQFVRDGHGRAVPGHRG